MLDHNITDVMQKVYHVTFETNLITTSMTPSFVSHFLKVADSNGASLKLLKEICCLQIHLKINRRQFQIKQIFL